MKTFIILLVAIASVCTAAYGQVEKGDSQPTGFNLDQDQLLRRLATLKPFTPDTEGSEPGHAFVVTQEEFRNSLTFLSEEKIDELMEKFDNAVAFSFKDDTQFLTLTRWKDQEAAQRFMKVEDDLWHLKDKQFKQYIKKVIYQEIDIAKDEKALLNRKTLQQDEQTQDVTIFVSARRKYLFECTVIGNYQDSEIKKLILNIWKIVGSSEKE